MSVNAANFLCKNLNIHKIIIAVIALTHVCVLHFFEKKNGQKSFTSATFVYKIFNIKPLLSLSIHFSLSFVNLSKLTFLKMSNIKEYIALKNNK